MFRNITIFAFALGLVACSSGTAITRTYVENGHTVTETLKGGAAVYGLYADAAVRLADARKDPDGQRNTCAPGDSVCTVAAEGFRAVRAMATANAAGAVTLAPPPRERDWAEKAKDFLTGAASIAVPAISGAVAINQSRDSRDIAIHRDDATTAQFGFATQSLRDLGVAVASTPTYAAGGDIVTGTQHIGDTVGDGSATRGGHIGDSVNGDGNATNGSQVGDNVDIGRDSIGRDNNHNCQAGNGAASGASGVGPTSGDAAPGGSGGACTSGGG